MSTNLTIKGLESNPRIVTSYLKLLQAEVKAEWIGENKIKEYTLLEFLNNDDIDSDDLIKITLEVDASVISFNER